MAHPLQGVDAAIAVAVDTAIYRDFLPRALAEGRYLAAPRPNVVEHSLGDIQHGVDTRRRRMSAQKVGVALRPDDSPNPERLSADQLPIAPAAARLAVPF